MNHSLVRQIWRRAQNRCEYCRLPVPLYPLPFSADHIIARQHGGETMSDNLALARLHCNRHKGPNIGGRNSETGEFSRLFHPRRDVWSDHFTWAGAFLTAKTIIGRVTVQVLAINDPDFLAVRQALIEEDAFPMD